MSDNKDVMDVEDTPKKEETSTEDEGLDNESVLQKYRLAAEVVNAAIAYLQKECVPGKRVVEICELGDKFITENAKKCFAKKKGMLKGIAFPTCVNVNQIVCHYSPYEDDQLALKENDVVRIDLGAHVDGYASFGAHTFILTNNQITGRAADVFAAAQTALHVATRLLKPGKKNSEITAAIKKISEEFGVSPAEGVLSHQIKRFVLDGQNTIILKETLDHHVEEVTFEENTVYVLDLVFTTSGEGRLKETQPKTGVYRRQAETSYNLKTQSARSTLNDINTRFGTFPFSVRALDKKTGRIGIVELFRHNLIDPYPVLCEKAGETAVHLKSTVLLLPRETQVLTGTQTIQSYVSEKKLQDANLLAVLATNLKSAKKKGKKDKKASDDTMDTTQE
ncbi:metallopeptidase family M24 protein [Acrasis kona]|uniref:Metallopeptidase family M24 protein n=1 Tax=Acrasis kona TaxID=1008807 RepID=A0AAW2ZBS8_9EUKA